MVNSNSDLERAPGVGSSPAVNSSGLATDNLTKRVGISANLSEKNVADDSRAESIDDESIKPAYDHTHRKLKPRHIQLIGIGGTIGTALYVQIGKSLGKGGPGSLFLAFVIWSVLVPSIDMHLVLVLPLAILPVSSTPRYLGRPRPLVSFGARRLEIVWSTCSESNKKTKRQTLKTNPSHQT